MGNALADIFASVRLALDGTGFEAQATALADKSGKNVGDRLSSNLSSSIKKASLSVLGAGAGAAFGVALSGAKELDDAVAKFTAQTGLAGEEAKVFGQNTQALFATNVQGWAEIGDALTGIQVHFKITGEAAKALGGQFLDFSRVAGGTAAESVNRFDELVDSGVISQSEMAVTMDKLIKSHQKFGVPINETIAALVKFAPAMHAAGLSTDDALGLMNMFTESGLNAEASTKAFNIALQKVKSPEELQRLMGDIASTEDPFKRAGLAADLFGRKAGVQIANALKPGSGGIAAWSVSLAEATGATQKAGDALDSSFGNQATLLLHQFGGALAGIGSNFGPLLMATAVLGPKLTTALTTGLGALAPLLFGKIVETTPAVEGASTVVGRAGGIAMGTAIGAGLTLAAVAAVAFAYVQIEGELKKQADQVASQATAWAKTATDAQLDAMRKEISAKKGEIPTIFGWDVLGGKAKVQQSVDEITKEIVAREIKGLTSAEVKGKLAETGRQIGEALKGDPRAESEATQGLIDRYKALETQLPLIVEEADKKVAAQLTDDSALIEKAAKDGYVGIPTAMEAAQFEAGLKLTNGIKAQIATIKSSRAELTSAWTDAIDSARRPQELDIEMRQTLGDINLAKMKTQAKGMNAWERDNAKLELGLAQDKYAKLLVESATYGTNAEKIVKLNGILQSKALLDGLSSADAGTVAMWIKVQADTKTQLDILNGKFNTAGTNWADAVIASIRAHLTDIGKAMEESAKAGKGAGGYAPQPGQGGTPPTSGGSSGGGFKRLAVGMPYVASVMPAILDPGEAVLTRTQADAWRGGQGVTNIFNFPHYVGSRSELTKAIAQELRLVGG